MAVAYLDTNALAKLYVQEAGFERVAALIEQTQTVVTSVITYAEVRTVFARRWHRTEITREQHDQMVAHFEEDWAEINEIDVTPRLYRRAGDLAVAHPRLQAMDALHLASVLEAREQASVRFLTFDGDLEAVAGALLGQQSLG